MPGIKLVQPIILVVEDNPDDAALSCRILQRQLPQARISTVADGHAAVECTQGVLSIDDKPVRAVPHLILLDLKLPKVPGLDVLQAVRGNASTHKVPVVVFSSSDERRDVESAYERGANTYVRKPNDYDEYVRVIKDIAAYWFDLATVPA